MMQCGEEVSHLAHNQEFASSILATAPIILKFLGTSLNFYYILFADEIFRKLCKYKIIGKSIN